MWPRIAIYGLGLATPFVVKRLCPVMRDVVKAGVIASDRVHEIVGSMRAEFREIAEEARADVSTELNGDTA